MRLSDIIGHISPTIYIQIGLILFLALFAGGAFYAWAMTGEKVKEMESLPLRDSSAFGGEE